MNGPHAFVQHLADSLYHPRSDEHSNALGRAILADLIDHCPRFAEDAKRGAIVAKLNHTVTVSHQRWTIDLAVGPPPGLPVPPSGGPIQWATPATVYLAMEIKGVMTEHGKARHNRLRDLQAFHHHAHIYNAKTIAVGIVVVNMSEVFWSPTRPTHDVTLHANIGQLGAQTIDLYRNLPLRNSHTDGPGLEAASVIVVRHDNLQKNHTPPPGTPAAQAPALVIKAPAPQVGDPLHYGTMVQRACAAYRERLP